MKYLGQYIQQFISRFRNDVFLEDVSSGTIASGGNLGLDSNNKIVKATISSTTDLTSDVTGILPVANGGTGASSLASGKVLVGNGTSTVSAGGASGAFRYTDLVSFTVPVDTMTVVSTNAADPQLHLTMSPSGATATGPSLRFIKDFSSGAGADDDVIGDIIYVSDDDAGGATIFSQVTATISDASNGQESGLYDIKVAAHGGGLAKGLSIFGGSQDDEVDVSIATGTSSVTTIAGTLTMGSTAFVNNSGVIQVATQGTIDHDSLANFVANEHIDWTSSSAGTIHSTNIPTLNQNTSGTAAGLSSTLAVSSGGTGATSLTDNAILLGNGTSAVEASSHLSYYSPSANLDYLRIGDNSTTGSGIITDNAAPLSIQVEANTGTDAAGGDMTFIAGQSTGNAAGGSFRFRSSPSVGSSGTGVNVPDEIAVLSQSGDLQLDGGITASNVFLPGGGTISFDDSLDGSDQFITGTDSNLTIDGDDKIKLRADTQIEIKSTSNADTVIITPNSGNIYTAGDIELGHASDTTISRSAAGKVTIEGNEIQTTNYHHHFLNAGFFLSFPFSRYIPLNGSINEQNTSTSSPEYTNFTWPYDGFVKKMILRTETDMGSTELKLYKGASGATVSTSMGAVTQTVDANNAVEFDFTSVTNTYSKGETMAVRVDPTDDPDGGQNITIELVFDLTT